MSTLTPEHLTFYRRADTRQGLNQVTAEPESAQPVFPRRTSPVAASTYVGPLDHDGEQFEVEVEYCISGRYRPARMYPNDRAAPEEYPTLDLLSARSLDGPVPDDVLQKHLESPALYDEIWEHLAEMEPER